LEVVEDDLTSRRHPGRQIDQSRGQRDEGGQGVRSKHVDLKGSFQPVDGFDPPTRLIDAGIVDHRVYRSEGSDLSGNGLGLG
jgi:hypothetical protein